MITHRPQASQWEWDADWAISLQFKIEFASYFVFVNTTFYGTIHQTLTMNICREKIIKPNPITININIDANQVKTLLQMVTLQGVWIGP